MNDASCVVYVAVFLALPPVLLVARAVDKGRMPWALLLGASVIGGWLLVNLAHMFYVNGMEVRMSVNGMQGGIPRSATDDFLFQFGWLLGLGYLLPWLFLYCMFVVARWMFAAAR